MKPFILFSLITLTSGFNPGAQTLADVDTNKYTIRLPGYWKPGNRIWKILTEKLPLVCEEIRDKELCGDNCNPRYTIELEIFEPLATNYDYYCTNLTSTGPVRNWVFLTYYNFQSSFLLLNEKRELITRFILVDTSETWMARKNESFRLQPEVTYRASRFAAGYSTYSLIRAQNPVAPIPQIRYRDTINPAAYINQNRHALLPSDLELFAIIDKKIRSW